eukprot:gene14580-19581_t
MEKYIETLKIIDEISHKSSSTANTEMFKTDKKYDTNKAVTNKKKNMRSQSPSNSLENMTQSSQIFTINDLPNANEIYHVAGKCCVYLFLQNQTHTYLENAHFHYQNSIEHMPADLFAMFKLPSVLLEFGKVLEYYGAVEAAIELYSKILTSFPNFRGYFDALYRTAIVGLYISSMTQDSKAKEETVGKSIDILQFLLEALPSSIREVDVIFLYIISLESSSSVSIRYRANNIYPTLYNLCKGDGHHLSNHKELDHINDSSMRTSNKNIANSTNHFDYKSWMKAPTTWLLLGDYFLANHAEFFLAKFSYDKFLVELEKQCGYNETLLSKLTCEICLKIAKLHSLFQHYDEAIKYAEMSLLINKYHKETRESLSKWNKSYALKLEKENLAISRIVDTWRGRCWTPGFIKKLKTKIIHDTEDQLIHDKSNELENFDNIDDYLHQNELDELLNQKNYRNYYNFEIREKLSYYAKEKYRFMFYYEELCAIKIQRTFRKKKLQWIWQQVHRNDLINKAYVLYRRYMKNPLDMELRNEIVMLMKHRLAPKRKEISTPKYKQNNKKLLINKNNNNSLELKRNNLNNFQNSKSNNLENNKINSISSRYNDEDSNDDDDDKNNNDESNRSMSPNSSRILSPIQTTRSISPSSRIKSPQHLINSHKKKNHHKNHKHHKDHPLIAIYELILKQNSKVSLIERCYFAYLVRKRIDGLVQLKRSNIFALKNKACIRIQTLIRMKFAMDYAQILYENKVLRINSVIKIQRWFLKKYKTFKYIVQRILERNDHKKAMAIRVSLYLLQN